MLQDAAALQCLKNAILAYGVLVAAGSFVGACAVSEALLVWLFICGATCATGTLALISSELGPATFLAQSSLLVPAACCSLLFGIAPVAKHPILLVARMFTIVVPLSVWHHLRNSGVPCLPVVAAAVLNLLLGKFNMTHACAPFLRWSNSGASLSMLHIIGVMVLVALMSVFLVSALPLRSQHRRSQCTSGSQQREEFPQCEFIERVVSALDEMASARQSVTQDLCGLCFLCRYSFGLPAELSVPAVVVSHIAEFLDGGWTVGRRPLKVDAASDCDECPMSSAVPGRGQDVDASCTGISRRRDASHSSEQTTELWNTVQD